MTTDNEVFQAIDDFSAGRISWDEYEDRVSDVYCCFCRARIYPDQLLSIYSAHWVTNLGFAHDPCHRWAYHEVTGRYP